MSPWQGLTISLCPFSSGSGSNTIRTKVLGTTLWTPGPKSYFAWRHISTTCTSVFNCMSHFVSFQHILDPFPYCITRLVLLCMLRRDLLWPVLLCDDPSLPGKARSSMHIPASLVRKKNRAVVWRKMLTLPGRLVVVRSVQFLMAQ